MELKDFVEQTLVQIVQGVRAAQASLDISGANAKINPTTYMRGGEKLLDNSLYRQNDLQIAQMVEFDVAVTAEEGKGTKGGIGIMVGAIGLGAQGQSDARQTSENRIKFKVPILLPKND